MGFKDGEAYKVEGRTMRRIHESVRDYEHRRRSGSGVSFKPKLPSQIGSEWIPFKNISGEAIPAFAVIRITGMFKPSDNWDGFYLTAAKPTSASDQVFAVNHVTAVPAQSDGNATGFCKLLTGEPGEVLYETNDGSPSIGQTWGPESGSWLLHLNKPGFVALGGAHDGRASFVQSTGADIHLAKATANIAKNASGTLQVLVGTPGAETPSGVTITAYNHFSAVSINDVALVVKAAGNWYIAGGGGGGDGKVKIDALDALDYLETKFDVSGGDVTPVDLPVVFTREPGLNGRLVPVVRASDIAGYASGVDQVLVKTSLNSWVFITLSQCTPI